MDYLKFLYILIPLIVAILLFFRSAKKTQVSNILMELEGNLHLITEMKKTLDQHGKDSTFLDARINELKSSLNKLKKIKS